MASAKHAACRCIPGGEASADMLTIECCPAQQATHCPDCKAAQHVNQATQCKCSAQVQSAGSQVASLQTAASQLSSLSLHWTPIRLAGLVTPLSPQCRCRAHQQLHQPQLDTCQTSAVPAPAAKSSHYRLIPAPGQPDHLQTARLRCTDCTSSSTDNSRTEMLAANHIPQVNC